MEGYWFVTLNNSVSVCVCVPLAYCESKRPGTWGFVVSIARGRDTGTLSQSPLAHSSEGSGRSSLSYKPVSSNHQIHNKADEHRVSDTQDHRLFPPSWSKVSCRFTTRLLLRRLLTLLDSCWNFSLLTSSHGFLRVGPRHQFLHLWDHQVRVGQELVRGHHQSSRTAAHHFIFLRVSGRFGCFWGMLIDQSVVLCYLTLSDLFVQGFKSCGISVGIDLS